MQKESENKTSIKDICSAITYFLAGSFLIWTIVSSKSASGVIEPMGWFTCVVGALLSVAGLVTLVIIPFKCLTNFRKVLESKYKKYINALVFTIAMTMLGVTVIGFLSYTPLFIIGIVFLCIVILMVIITSWSTVFKNVPSLLTVTLSLNVLAIFILFTEASNIQLTTVLGLSLVFLSLALNQVTKHTTP